MRKGERMKLKEYQDKAKRTLGNACRGNIIMGIFGETGEVVDYLKKVIYHNHELDGNKLVEELGDMLWYVAAAFSINELSIDDIHPSKCVDGYMLKNLKLHGLVDLLIQNTSRLVAEAYSAQMGFELFKLRNYGFAAVSIIHELAIRVGSSIEEVVALNIAKLEKRYPDGFDQARSINREGYHEGPSS